LFPVCYFLVAVPWPTWLEQTLIQGLTRVDAGAAVDLLGWLGIPALQHGNVIEVATGVVGIDEACSGIRSFQATLMISLFLGEFYRLSVARRVVLCFSGFALSFLFNLARMTLLVWVAARQGVAAIAAWHDPAGVTILLGCFLGLWGLGIWLHSSRGQGRQRGKRGEEAGALGSEVSSPWSKVRRPVIQWSAFSLCMWILVTEISVETWYRAHEARLPRATQWTLAWPTNNVAFKELPVAGRTRQILRYDEGRSAAWEENGLGWQAIFLRWNPGRTALHLAQNHTPGGCLTAAGHAVEVVAPQRWFDLGGSNSVRLPFAIYELTDTARPVYIFYCLWNDRSSAQGFEGAGLTYDLRLAPVLAGIRNPGQRSLEIALTGPETAAAAEASMRTELEQLIRTR